MKQREHPYTLPIPVDPDDAANYWFTRRQGGLMQPGDEAQFQYWLADDAAHPQAYEEISTVWRLTQRVPDAVFKAVLPPAPVATPTPSRRQFLWLSGGVAMAAVTGFSIRSLLQEEPLLFQESYRTARGQHQALQWQDDSTAWLNTESVLQVMFTASQRLVLLEQGEALFKVGNDKQRPFLVKTSQAEIHASSAEFSVRQDNSHTAVTVLAGELEMRANQWWHRSTALLRPNQQLRIPTEGAWSDIEVVNATAVAAWHRNQVVFDRTPLRQIIHELNRYRAQPIFLDAPLYESSRLSGVFELDRIDDFLQRLPNLIPVNVVRHADGSVMIVSKTTV